MKIPNSQLEVASTNDGCWRDIDWKQVRLHVYKLQKRIYSYSKEGNIRKVRQLQNTLVNSYNAKLLAVRRVSQDNQGKSTAGVDGVKKLKPEQRFELAKTLCIGPKASLLRRVWIPKNGSLEKRPLGIPTIKDRAVQALLKLALEPEWEEKFEPNSYGFRPGRNCHDAIRAILIGIEKKSKYVLDADIAKCFDRIDHKALLQKIKMKGRFRQQIKAWLKSGVLDSSVFASTEKGTPQGGVISPLLANIALHGLENRLKEYIDTVELRGPNGVKMGSRDKRRSLQIIRYADDFVILHYDKTVILECKRVFEQWLSEMGLELSLAKTRITHTLELTGQDIEEFGIHKPGFDFLGFNIRQFKSKYRSAKDGQSRRTGYKTIVIPAKEKCKAYQRKLGHLIGRRINVTQESLIFELERIIVGWARYFGCSDALTRGVLQKMDYLLYLKLRRWAKRRSKTSAKGRHYWRTLGYRNWVFSTQTGIKLSFHTDYASSIHEYTKVRGKASPYDGNYVYWATRMGTNPSLPANVAKLLKIQKGKCGRCKMVFTENEVLEIDHMIPLAEGGSKKYDNLMLLCRECHDIKTRNDFLIKTTSENSHDKG